MICCCFFRFVSICFSHPTESINKKQTRVIIWSMRSWLRFVLPFDLNFENASLESCELSSVMPHQWISSTSGQFQEWSDTRQPVLLFEIPCEHHQLWHCSFVSKRKNKTSMTIKTVNQLIWLWQKSEKLIVFSSFCALTKLATPRVLRLRICEMS